MKNLLKNSFSKIKLCTGLSDSRDTGIMELGLFHFIGRSFATQAKSTRKKPSTGPWTQEDRAEANRQYRQRKMFHKWRVRLHTDDKDWYDLWVEAQEARNAERGLPPWYRDPPIIPPRPKGFVNSVKWWFEWTWFNWEILWLAIILAPMFAVLLYF